MFSKKLIALGITVLLLLIGLAVLVIYAMSQLSSRDNVRDHDTFVSELAKLKGEENIKVLEESPNEFFSVKPKRISIKEEQVDIYEFESADKAREQARKVSQDGSTIEEYGKFEWPQAPHFYLEDRIIVFYTGEDRETLDVLQKTLGRQFAGRS